MIKSVFILAFVVFIGFNTSAQTLHQWSLTSPDKKYEVSIEQRQLKDGKRQLYYKVNYDKKTAVLESELGVLIENQLFESAMGIENDPSEKWFENLDFRKTTDRAVSTSWKPVYGERSTIKENFNELTLHFTKFEEVAVLAEGLQGTTYDKRRSYEAQVILRAYNEGVAFTYHFPETKNGAFLHITGEQTSFTFPEGTLAYHERWAQAPVNLKPLKDWKDESERPLTLKLQNGLYVALLEAQMVDYSRGKFKLTKENTVQVSTYDNVNATTPYSTPWRVIMAANTPGELLENNDIVLNLNEPNKIKNTSWIKPGKVIRSGLSTKEAKACVDFAVERNLQYVHLDAGWYGPEMKVSSDASKVAENRDINMQEIVQYAKERNIGVFLYINQRALTQQIDTLFPILRKWGIKGVKFGFVHIGSNRWTVWLHEAIKKAAENELLVDIHDEYRPTGFSRTYPNLLTQEGIHGNEEMPDATHNTTLPFTRFLAGAGDYTICYYNSRIKTTHAHQLALSVVYYSPLQFMYWYDNPTLYRGEPEIEFFDKVKTVWDDTKVLNGQIGEYATVARRSGDEWFVGSIGNNNGQNVSFDLSFLDAGKSYILKSYTDDDTVQTRTKVKVQSFLVNHSTELQLNLKKSGGAAFYLVSASEAELKQFRKKIEKGLKL